MQVTVKGFDMDKIDEITEACKEEWDFEDLVLSHMDSDPVLIGDAEGNLCAGETEEQFTDRIAAAIWKANGYCPVTVRAVYLENLPCEIHERTHKHYQRWLKKEAA
jgi:hypothetical protein